MERRLFTSESVTEGHPDKICDQISDAVLDAIIAQDPTARVACETTCTTGMVNVMGEITTSCYVDIPKIARQVVREIGYDRAKYGLTATPVPWSLPSMSNPATSPWAWTALWKPKARGPRKKTTAPGTRA